MSLLFSPFRKDPTPVEMASGSRVAGVFAQSRFCATLEQVCKANLSGGVIREVAKRSVGGCAPDCLEEKPVVCRGMPRIARLARQPFCNLLKLSVTQAHTHHCESTQSQDMATSGAG